MKFRFIIVALENSTYLKCQWQQNFTEQLKDRLNLNVDETDKLTLEDLRQQVDRNVREVRICVVEVAALVVM